MESALTSFSKPTSRVSVIKLTWRTTTTAKIMYTRSAIRTKSLATVQIDIPTRGIILLSLPVFLALLQFSNPAGHLLLCRGLEQLQS